MSKAMTSNSVDRAFVSQPPLVPQEFFHPKLPSNSLMFYENNLFEVLEPNPVKYKCIQPCNRILIQPYDDGHWNAYFSHRGGSNCCLPLLRTEYQEVWSQSNEHLSFQDSSSCSLGGYKFQSRKSKSDKSEMKVLYCVQNECPAKIRLVSTSSDLPPFLQVPHTFNLETMSYNCILHNHAAFSLEMNQDEPATKRSKPTSNDTGPSNLKSHSPPQLNSDQVPPNSSPTFCQPCHIQLPEATTSNQGGITKSNRDNQKELLMEPLELVRSLGSKNQEFIYLDSQGYLYHKKFGRGIKKFTCRTTGCPGKVRVSKEIQGQVTLFLQPHSEEVNCRSPEDKIFRFQTSGDIEFVQIAGSKSESVIFNGSRFKSDRTYSSFPCVRKIDKKTCEGKIRIMDNISCFATPLTHTNCDDFELSLMVPFERDPLNPSSFLPYDTHTLVGCSNRTLSRKGVKSLKKVELQDRAIPTYPNPARVSTTFHKIFSSQPMPPNPPALSPRMSQVEEQYLAHALDSLGLSPPSSQTKNCQVHLRPEEVKYAENLLLTPLPRDQKQSKVTPKDNEKVDLGSKSILLKVRSILQDYLKISETEEPSEKWIRLIEEFVELNIRAEAREGLNMNRVRLSSIPGYYYTIGWDKDGWTLIVKIKQKNGTYRTVYKCSHPPCWKRGQKDDHGFVACTTHSTTQMLTVVVVQDVASPLLVFGIMLLRHPRCTLDEPFTQIMFNQSLSSSRTLGNYVRENRQSKSKTNLQMFYSKSFPAIGNARAELAANRLYGDLQAGFYLLASHHENFIFLRSQLCTPTRSPHLFEFLRASKMAGINLENKDEYAERKERQEAGSKSRALSTFLEILDYASTDYHSLEDGPDGCANLCFHSTDSCPEIQDLAVVYTIKGPKNEEYHGFNERPNPKRIYAKCHLNPNTDSTNIGKLMRENNLTNSWYENNSWIELASSSVEEAKVLETIAIFARILVASRDPSVLLVNERIPAYLLGRPEREMLQTYILKKFGLLLYLECDAIPEPLLNTQFIDETYTF